MCREKKISELRSSIEETMVSLYDRWEDEREYEDFSGYEEIMKKQCLQTEGITFIKGTKHPFGFQFKIGGNAYSYEMIADEKYLTVSISEI